MSANILFLVAVIVPVFFASPRTAPMWLSIQALALAWQVATHHGFHSIHGLVSMTEILLIRGVTAPWLLRRATAHHEAPIDHLLPSNLFAWILGISVTILAFEFAARAAPTDAALIMGGVCATVVLALLLLSLNAAPTSQIFALLIMENAAALFESRFSGPWAPWVHAALTSVYVLTVLVGVRLVRLLGADSNSELPREVL
jgi:hypothetical protein